MKTILRQSESLIRDRGSKFLGYLFPCESEEEFSAVLDSLKSEHYDATHHCTAYRIHPNEPEEFSNDDGEPSGTAGLPILNQLRSADLINVGAVIVRYYGGTKLGKSGLIEAYKSTARQLTEEAEIHEVISVQEYQIHYPYNEELVYSKMEKSFGLIEESAAYTDSVTKRIACPAGQAASFEKYHKTVKHLGIALELLDKTYLVR